MKATKTAEVISSCRLQNDELLLFDPLGTPCIRRVSDIITLDAICEEYTQVCFLERSVLVRKPLFECATQLNPKTFVQANRGCVVNLVHVRTIRIADSLLRYVFILTNDREVLVSRRCSLTLRQTRVL